MNYKMIRRFIAQILAVSAVFMIPAWLISWSCGEEASADAFVQTMLLIGVISGGLAFLCKGASRVFHAREGMVCVGICWIVLSLTGCLPFYLSGEYPSYIDAFFEIVSGFTTTGATTLSDVEVLPKGIIYWRCFSQWLGGMGVLVLLLAIIPSTGGNGYTMHLLRAESPGPDVGKIVPRMKKTAVILYVLYVVLTIINMLFLVVGKMPLFEALCTAFSTAGTGGFSIKNDSMAGYSPYLRNVTTVFMALFGVNFSCYYLLLIGQFRSVFKDEELRLYLGLIFGSILLITLNIRGLYDSLWDALHHAAFQVSSIITSTCYATTNYDLWPSFAKTILMCLMVTGACAGSTGGGFKCIRILLLVKGIRRNTRQVISPQYVKVIRNNGRAINEQVVTNTFAYFAAYVMLMIVSILLISIDGYSFGTNFSAVLASMNNMGPGIEAVGPTCNFSGYSAFSKLVLAFDMLAGRLELFPIFVLFSRDMWRRR
ncbi:MAG: TrkH family potassium uptake protein [Clostridia bacterium]|nr:TrkH family potassium uptake protein [Clostridia bacterium]